MIEIFRQYKDTEYNISSYGRVHSRRNNVYLRQHDDGHGYLKVTLWVDGIQMSYKVHRLVAEVFVGAPSPWLTVNHIDGVKKNNNVTNLEWMTKSENTSEAWKQGQMVRGEATSQAILNDHTVEEIKLLFVENELNNKQIAELYGVERGTIGKIRQLKTWKHIRPDLIFENSSPDVAVCAKKLSGEDIPEIRKLYAAGVSLAEIGRMFNVHSGTISGIASGKTWKNY